MLPIQNLRSLLPLSDEGIGPGAADAQGSPGLLSESLLSGAIDTPADAGANRAADSVAPAPSDSPTNTSPLVLGDHLAVTQLHPETFLSPPHAAAVLDGRDAEQRVSDAMEKHKQLLGELRQAG